MLPIENPNAFPEAASRWEVCRALWRVRSSVAARRTEPREGQADVENGLFQREQCGADQSDGWLDKGRHGD